MIPLVFFILAYTRAAFGGWVDVDHDCQDTRAEILIARSLVPVTYTLPNHCRVATGLWVDEYTGELERNATHLDVDHVVPLAEAWRSGADGWDDSRRSQFSNDPFELALTNLHLNRSKGDRTPDAWLPESEPWHCMYVARWAIVKQRWNLSVTPAELTALTACQ